MRERKRSKLFWIGFSSFILGVVVACFFLFPVHTNKSKKEQFVSTGMEAVVVVGDNQSWENEYGRLTVWPKTASNIVRQTQYAEVLWKYPDNMIDISFRFNNSLSNADIWMWQNISHDVSIPDYDWITHNYTLFNISDFELISEPGSVLFGDIPSDFYASGNCSMWMGEDYYESLGYIDIGFDSWNWLNSEHTVCEFNYTYWGVVGYHIEQQYWMDWNSKKSSFYHTIYNGKHYYYVKDVPVIQDKVYNFKWQYDIPIHSSGKWDLMAKLSSDTIQEAFSSGRYIMLDPWWSSNWEYYQTITIDSDYIDSDLVNFPVLVNSTDTSLIAKCDGGDSIRFLAGHNSGGTENQTEFYYEIEEWSVGGFSIWVNVSLIHSDVDTQFLLYYGNSGASDNQDHENVWDSNYVMVQHMNETASTDAGHFKDSTTYDNDGTLVDVDTDTISARGKVGLGIDFDGDADTINCGQNAITRIDDRPFTMEGWIKSDDLSSSNSLWGKGNTPSTNQSMTIYIYNSRSRFAFYGNDLQYNHVPSNDVWYYYTGAYDASANDRRLYINDSLVASDTASGNLTNTDLKDLYLASFHGASQLFVDGLLDEMRLSNIQRNASWTKANFHTQNQSSGFLSWGSEQSAPPSDTTTPVILINFVGNLSDSGGPYYRPPGESVQLTGVWSDGYYANDSHQQENFTYINISIIEPESDLTSVYLNWYNQTGDTWTNDTYSFTNMTGGYWDINTSEHFDVSSGHNYSFNINATSTGGTNWTAWNKTGLNVEGANVRRFVQLNCTPVDIAFTPFYLSNLTETIDVAAPDDTCTYDRLHHDQGTDGTATDAGYLLSDTPTDVVDFVFCTVYVGFWFDDDICIQDITVENMYLHLWWGEQWDGYEDSTYVGYKNSREDFCFAGSFPIWCDEYYFTNESIAKSNITYDNGVDGWDSDYHLETKWWDISDFSKTDNNIYEFVFGISRINVHYPHVINNRSFNSFILFNVPDNVTLNSDTDGDTLSDYTELWVTFTNPFLADTDNDGVNDYDENNVTGSDPNNFTDTIFPPSVSRTPTQVFNHWFQCGNYTARTPTQVFNHWFSCGNGSERNPTLVFNHWWSCGNYTARTPTQVFNYWFQCGNITIRSPTQVFNHWFSCGNGTARSPLQVFNHWWSCGNGSLRNPTMVFNNWFLCGNITGRTPTQVFNHWFLCGNGTARSPTEVFNYWFRCGNGTARTDTQIFNHWFSCGNITLYIIEITSPYPSNSSFNIPLQPTIYVNITNSQGNNMNVSWYYGTSMGNENTLLGTDTGQTNGTVTELFHTANARATICYWRVMVENGTNWRNESYTFTTEGYAGGGGGQQPSSALWSLSLFGILGLALWLISYKKKKKKEENDYEE